MSETLVIYTIHDMKAKAYITPVSSTNDDVARRLFHAAVNDPATDFFKYPEDYTLFRTGTFSLQTGELKEEQMRAICKAIDLKEGVMHD